MIERAQRLLVYFACFMIGPLIGSALLSVSPSYDAAYAAYTIIFAIVLVGACVIIAIAMRGGI